MPVVWDIFPKVYLDPILLVELVKRGQCSRSLVTSVGMFIVIFLPHVLPVIGALIHDDRRSWLLQYSQNNDGEVVPRLTHVCHCVLLWVFDVSQGRKDEQG